MLNIDTVSKEIDSTEWNIKNSWWLWKQEVINFIYNPKNNLNIEEKNLIIKIWNENQNKYWDKWIPVNNFTKYLRIAIWRNTSDKTKIIKEEVKKVEPKKAEPKKAEPKEAEPKEVEPKEVEHKKLKIELYSEKYRSDLEEFKRYCEKHNKASEKYLAEIHKKMNVSKDDFMFFWPKTIDYLNNNIYDYKEKYKEEKKLINNFVNSLEKEKNKSIPLNISTYLSKINTYLSKNKNDTLSLNLKAVKSHLEELKNRWETTFKVYSDETYWRSKTSLVNSLKWKHSSIFWNIEWKNINWTYITSWLDKDVEKCTILNWKSKNNDAYIVKQDWKYRLYFYKNWELKVASYVSPWKSNWKWWGFWLTKKWNFTIYKPELNHISNSFRWLRIKDWVIVWWSMLNSRRIKWAQHLHISSNVTWDRASHWCVRIPSFYSIALWQYNNIKLHILDN